MGFHHRKLIPQLCQFICHTEQKPCLSDCKDCIRLCLTNPYSYYYSQPPPITPLYLDQHEGKHHKISTYLILSVSILLAAFFVVCCHAIYTKFLSRRRTRVLVLSRQQQTQENHDDFVDQEHGPVMDHPIWYIRTIGLDESIISAITVCRYKKGEGLIEGTECSVCLSEFQENESLRLLPKCHHAFHLPCIDTWLASHTNCPMCRAPIVTNPTRIPSLVPNNLVVDPTSLENSASHAPEERELSNSADEEGESDVEDETRVCETESVVVNIRPRRSVSLDSSSVANINLALALASVQSSTESGENEEIVSKSFVGNENFPTTSNSKRSSSFRTRYLHNVLHSSMKRSHSFNGKYLVSWYSRNQRKQNASLGSF